MLLLSSPGSLLLFLFCYAFRHCFKTDVLWTIVQWWLCSYFKGVPVGQTHNEESSLETVNSVTLDQFWTSLYKHSSETKASWIFKKFNLSGKKRERVTEVIERERHMPQKRGTLDWELIGWEGKMHIRLAIYRSWNLRGALKLHHTLRNGILSSL